MRMSLLAIVLVFLAFMGSTRLAPAAELANILKDPTRLESWIFEQHESAVLSPAIEDGVLSLTVKNPSDQTWHIQVYQPRLDLIEGEQYTIRFRARSDAPRTYSVNVGAAVGDYHSVSPIFSFKTTHQWQDYSFSFRAADVIPGASRGPLFALGTQIGTLFLADIAIDGPKPAQAKTPIPEGFFEFPLRWDDTLRGVITDVSFLNEKPAGRNGYILTRDGRFVEEKTGNRIRFFGTNMGASEAFPTKADAELIARRLAKAGVNIVRLHHLDNPWAIQTGGSIWAKGRPDRQQFDPEQLDKLDYLVHCLKEQGIYVNINLKVSKELTPADGMPESIRDVRFTHQKRIDFFMPRMIELQKDYARRLLTHRNPYTGMTYAEDPAVACVEINNENSLVGYWTSTLGQGLDTLPPEFSDELARQWTAWLNRKYESDETLFASWMQGMEEAGESILTGNESWTLETHDTTGAEIATSAAAGRGLAPDLLAEVTKIDGTDWHIQAKIEGLTLQEGRQYTVSFRARADKPRSVTLTATIDQPDWHNVGLTQSVRLGVEERAYSYTFTASRPEPQHVRISFLIGGGVGKLRISGLELCPGAKGSGLRPGETLASGIGIPGAMTPRQSADWIHFLADTERAYADTMYDLLKNEIGIKSNLALSQIDYGGAVGLHREARMDFADTHGYWQHPSFPNADWSSTNWTISNTPQIAALSDRGFGEMGRMSLTRVAGKPYAVSEYDHPAPSDYACEMMPTYAAAACVQDWDAIYSFAIAPYGAAAHPDRINGYFDQNNHPAKWCFYPTAALVFRQGLIPSATRVATVELPSPIWESHHFVDRAWHSLIPRGPIGFLTRRLQVSDRPLPAGEKPRLVESGNEAQPSVRLSGEAGTRVLIADAPQVSQFVGFVGGQSLSTESSSIDVKSFGKNFGAITLVATDGQPLRSSRKVLVTICGQVENQGITWNENRTSIGARWGHGPTIAQFIPATIELQADGPRKVYALDATGHRKAEIPVTTENGKLSFATSIEHATLLYEVSE